MIKLTVVSPQWFCLTRFTCFWVKSVNCFLIWNSFSSVRLFWQHSKEVIDRPMESFWGISERSWRQAESWCTQPKTADLFTFCVYQQWCAISSVSTAAHMWKYSYWGRSSFELKGNFTFAEILHQDRSEGNVRQTSSSDDVRHVHTTPLWFKNGQVSLRFLLIILIKINFQLADLATPKRTT